VFDEWRIKVLSNYYSLENSGHAWLAGKKMHLGGASIRFRDKQGLKNKQPEMKKASK